MARWSHRRTYAGAGGGDRAVLRNGSVVGRTYRIEHGPAAGQWKWFGTWNGPGNQGDAPTLAGALKAVRSAFESR